MQLEKKLQWCKGEKVKMRNSVSYAPLLNIHIKSIFLCFRALFVSGRQSHFLFVKLLGTRKWVNPFWWEEKGVCRHMWGVCGWLWTIFQVAWSPALLPAKLHLNFIWLNLFNMSFSAAMAMLICSDSQFSACLTSTFVALSSYPSSFFLELCTVCFTSPRCLRALKDNYCQMML